MKNGSRYNFAIILPNLLTSASIFSGIFSIINATQHNFTKAAWLILLALVFDGLDGRVARLTNSCSKFGVEFDSLADIVSFGVAPAILVYLFAGVDYGRFGIVISALYVIFGAIRLARFNVMSSSIEPSVFIGVPIPTAAVSISLLVLLFQKYPTLHDAIFLLVVAVIVSLLMVSNIRYPSFKKLDMDKRHIRRVFIAMTAVLLLIFIYPIEGIVLLFFFYILYGPLRALYTILKKRKAL
ncbi:CDP-diacylglycerol--serine O-phosphatidyltransferase [hydrothermal vent metagenome]|uniref:CDP-diacylglycerol--serine O-phosphatidyltransferase n=1 Tax=hydrothermal vent metagenome TaxID=652676 RepID=A0A1W1BRA8_9ZZZZ